MAKEFGPSIESRRSGQSDCDSNRLFIRVELDGPSAEGANWVQLTLTKSLLARFAYVSGLLSQHQLEVVTTEIDAIWRLKPGWKVHERYQAKPSWIELWDGGFTIKCMIDPTASHSESLGLTRTVEATYVWGSVDEFVAYHCLDADAVRWDDLATAGGWTPPISGEPDEMTKFGELVAEHLRKNMDIPLNPPIVVV